MAGSGQMSVSRCQSAAVNASKCGGYRAVFICSEFPSLAFDWVAVELTQQDFSVL